MTRPTDQGTALREQLAGLLDWEAAHAGPRRVLTGIPPELQGTAPPDHPHTPWQLLEHLRLSQADILAFCRDPDYEELAWPEGYWPVTPAPPEPTAWDGSVRCFFADLETLQALAREPATDLFALIPWGEGQTILREILLVADHNAHHLGQLILLRRALGCW